MCAAWPGDPQAPAAALGLQAPAFREKDPGSIRGRGLGTPPRPAKHAGPGAAMATRAARPAPPPAWPLRPEAPGTTPRRRRRGPLPRPVGRRCGEGSGTAKMVGAAGGEGRDQQEARAFALSPPLLEVGERKGNGLGGERGAARASGLTVPTYAFPRGPGPPSSLRGGPGWGLPSLGSRM